VREPVLMNPIFLSVFNLLIPEKSFRDEYDWVQVGNGGWDQQRGADSGRRGGSNKPKSPGQARLLGANIYPGYYQKALLGT